MYNLGYSMKYYDDEEQKKKDEEEKRLIEEYIKKKEKMDQEEEQRKNELRKNHGLGEKNSSYGLGYEVSEDIGFFDQLIIALTKPRKLLGLSELSGGKFAKYVVLLALLLSFVTVIIPAAATVTGFKGFKNLFLNSMPAFKVEDGKLKAEDTFMMRISEVTILMDTEDETVSKEKLDATGFYITIGSRYIQMVYAQAGVVQPFYIYPIGIFFQNGYTNETFVSMIPAFYLGILITALFQMLLISLIFFIWGLIFSLKSWMLIKRSGLHMDYGNDLRTSCYASTWMLVLNNLNTAAGAIVSPMIVFLVGLFIVSLFISKAVGSYIKTGLED